MRSKPLPDDPTPAPAVTAAAAAAPAAVRARRWRVSVTLVMVFGSTGLVALAVGLVLYLGVYVATENTSQLLQARSRTLVDAVQAQLDATLQPVAEQAHWIASHLQRGDIDISAGAALDAFMTGTLAATPQVAGVAVLDMDARPRGWAREGDRLAIENWLGRQQLVQRLEAGRQRRTPGWNLPSWSFALGRAVIEYETPLRRGDDFIGVLVQVVPISQLSRTLAAMQQQRTMVPFVLFEDDRVLAHPLLAEWTPAGSGVDAPLPTVQQLGDRVLPRLRTSDGVPMLLRGVQGLTAGKADIDGHRRVFLHRDVAGYGASAWTLGVHLDAAAEAGDSRRRIEAVVKVGVALLLLSIAIAAFAGRRLSRPVKLLASAAEAVRAGDFDRIPALPGSRVRELDIALGAFEQMVAGLRERQLIRDVLGRFIPESVARSLLAGGGDLVAEEGEATLLFSDLEGFTRLTERMGPAGTVALLNEYFEAMVDILERHGGVVTQFQGDAILATFNVPIANARHAASALRAALEMQRTVRVRRFAGEALVCRIGVNTGAVVAGAVGARGRSSYTVHGDAVNLAARLEQLNKEHGTLILVSEATASRTTGFDLRSVGEVSVRGQSRPVRLFELRSRDEQATPA